MVRRAILAALAVFGFMTGSVAGEQAGVDLAGLGGWDIVVANDASPSEAYAAEEFRSIFAQATGIELSTVTTPGRADRHVFIGPSKPLSESAVGFDATAMGPEALRIVVRDNLIAIAGGRPRGTLYGVYTFLEDHLGVLRIVKEAVQAELKSHPGMENISVSQNDNAKNCLCPNCKAIDDREGTPMGTLLEFVNAIAKEHPQVKVGTLSYWYTRKPPRTLKPRPNVQIQLCSIECCMIHPINDPKCEKNVQFCRDMDEWGKLTKNIFIWNYNTNFSNYLLPCPNLRVIEPNIRYFQSNGAKGIFMQAAGNSTGAELSDLRNYVIANLLWDPSRSGQKLIDEFLDLHYGKAAPPIRRFINQYHDRCESKGIRRNCFGRAADYAIDESVAKATMEAFAEALALADSDAVKARVEKASICGYRAAIDPAWESPGKKPLDPAEAGRMRPLVKRLCELCSRYGVPMFSEGTTLEKAKERLRANLGLKAGEEF